jgi:hypothetical protein
MILLELEIAILMRLAIIKFIIYIATGKTKQLREWFYFNIAGRLTNFLFISILPKMDAVSLRFKIFWRVASLRNLISLRSLI